MQKRVSCWSCSTRSNPVKRKLLKSENKTMTLLGRAGASHKAFVRGVTHKLWGCTWFVANASLRGSQRPYKEFVYVLCVSLEHLQENARSTGSLSC